MKIFLMEKQKHILTIDGYTRKIRNNHLYISHDLVNIINEFYQNGLYPSQAIVPEFVKDLKIFYYCELFRHLSYKWDIDDIFFEKWNILSNEKNCSLERPKNLN